MRMTEKKEKKNHFALLILLITAFAAVLRIICCFWGYPYCLHPDECVIVEPAIDMLARHSWKAYSYFRPDQVEIKLDAILFTLLSWIWYHKPAYEAFEEHKIVFYLAARGLTAFFGTAIIPLAVSFVDRLIPESEHMIKRTAQMITAAILAFSALFVQHSAYATPDIVVSFFILLFARYSIRYIERGDMYSLIACGVSIGLGVATKYPAAVMSIPIAIAVIYRAIRIEKKPVNILKGGMIVAAVAAITVFAVAPNIFTDYRTVYEHLVSEANGKNEGTYGLGFSGNFIFYLKTFCKDIGAVSAVFFAAGVGYIIKHRNRKWFSMFAGLTYWICISVIQLHWARWGIPQYVFYVITVSIGIGYILQFVLMKSSGVGYAKVCFALCYCVIGVFLVSMVLSGICYTKSSRTPDTRLTAMRYMEEHDINRENSVYTTYTPFSLEDGLRENDLFDCSEEYVNVIPFYSTKEYYITNQDLKDRRLLEKERFRDSIFLSNSIEQKYRLIHEEVADGNYDTSYSILGNIYNSVRYLSAHHDSTGTSIQIYDLAPRFVSVRNFATGQFLNFSENDNKDLKAELTGEPGKWLVYEDIDGTGALINAEYTDEKYLQYALIPGNTGLLLKADNLDLSSAENLRDLSGQWTIEKEEDGYFFVNSDGKALSCVDGGLCLEDIGERSDRQRWLVFDYENQ